jgi:hypothetical protein
MQRKPSATDFEGSTFTSHANACSGIQSETKACKTKTWALESLQQPQTHAFSNKLEGIRVSRRTPLERQKKHRLATKRLGSIRGKPKIT